jgi:hypothetical protein
MAAGTPLTRAAAVAVALSVSATALVGQTAIKLPKNKYTPEQHVQLGR